MCLNVSVQRACVAPSGSCCSGLLLFRFLSEVKGAHFFMWQTAQVLRPLEGAGFKEAGAYSLKNNRGFPFELGRAKVNMGNDEWSSRAHHLDV